MRECKEKEIIKKERKMKKLMNMYGKFISTVLAFAMIATTVSTPVFASVTYSDEVVEEAADVVAEQYAAGTNEKIFNANDFEAEAGDVTTSIKNAENGIFTFPGTSKEKFTIETSTGNSSTVNGKPLTFTADLKTNGARSIYFDAPAKGEVYVAMRTGSNGDETRTLKLFNADETYKKTGTELGSFCALKDQSIQAVKYNVPDEGKYVFETSNSIKLFYMEFVSGIVEKHTVEFKVGELTVSTNQVEDGHTVAAPEDPELEEGEEFLGWYAGETKWTETLEIKASMTFEAKISSSVKTVSVNIVNEEMGTVSINNISQKTYKFESGETVSVNIAPKSTAYKVDYVNVKTVVSQNEVPVSANKATRTYTFTMPEEDVALNVAFTNATIHNVTATAGEHGTVSVNKVKAYEGDVIEIYPTPETGYSVDEVKVDGEKKDKDKNGKYTFTMKDADAEVEVTFCEQKYEIEVDFNGHGGENYIVEVKEGEKLAELPTPTAEGYEFLGWYLGRSGIVKYNFDAPIVKNGYVSAYWLKEGAEKIEFPYTIDPNTGLAVANDDALVKGTKYGNEKFVYFVPGENFKFGNKDAGNAGYGYQGKNNPSPAPTGTNVVTSGAYFDIYAVKDAVVHIEHLVGKSGTEKFCYFTEVADDGESATLITKCRNDAPANKSDVFYATEFEVKAGKRYQMAVNGSKTVIINASFYVGSNSITVSENIVNGSVSVNKTTARPGDGVEITTAPATGYAVDTVTVTTVGNDVVETEHVANNKYTFEMPNTSVVVGATFALGKKVTVSKNEVTDKVLESKSDPAIPGRTVEIIAVPNDHYEITPGMEAITVTTASGKNVPLTNSDNEKKVYTFTMVEEDVVVNTNFSKIPTSNIYIESKGNGEVKLLEPASANDVEKGEKVYFQAIPAGKGSVKSVKVTDANGNDVKFTTGASNKYNFLMPAVDVTISVVFTGGGSGSGDFEYSYEDTWTFVNAAIKPAVTVTYDGVELAEGTDYAVSYKNNTKASFLNGVAAEGLYKGCIDFDATDETAVEELLKKVEAKDKDAKKLLAKIPTITVTGKGNFAGKVQTLYFNIVPFTVDVNENAVEVKSGKIALTTKGTKFPFNGSEIDPIADGKLTVTGKIGKDTKTFTTDDFDYVVVNNVNAGTANILLLFKGNYKCAKPVKGSFKIEKADATDTKVIEKTITGSIATVTYGIKGANPTNDDIVAAVKSSCGGIVLGRDFKVSFKNNKKVATAADGKKAPTVVLTGAGNYKGKVELNYEIAQADIAKLEVAFPGVTVGKAINSAKPVILDVNRNEVAASKFVIKYTLNGEDATGKEKVKAGDEITATLTPNPKATEFTIDESAAPAAFDISVGTVGKLKATLIKVKDVQELTEAKFNEVYGEGQYKKLKSKTVASVLGVDQYLSEIDLTADYEVVPGVSTKLVDVTFTAKGQKTGVNVNDDATFTLTSRAKKGSASAYVTVGVADGANGLVKVSLPVAAKTMK